VSISYRDHHFWIDDRDITTKRNSGEKKSLPTITISAQ
jgi:hypothetical protein